MTNCSFLLRPFANDELLRRFTMASLLAHSDLAPLGLRLAANWGFAFPTTVGMVTRIHRRAAHGGPEAHVAGTARPTDAERGGRRVSAPTPSGPALHLDKSGFTPRHARPRPPA